MIILNGKILDRLMEAARQCLVKGPENCRDEIALKLAAKLMEPASLKEEQAILDQWHSLFRIGRLVRGIDIARPNAPYFHIPIK